MVHTNPKTWRAYNLTKSLELAEEADTPFARRFIREVQQEMLRQPDYEVIARLTDADLQTVWRSLWASQKDWEYTDKGPHGFATVQDWADALASELSARSIK